jgi:peptidoglycan/xylan/chitin deacetylase (PgdA/CDA1 family)
MVHDLCQWVMTNGLRIAAVFVLSGVVMPTDSEPEPIVTAIANMALDTENTLTPAVPDGQVIWHMPRHTRHVALTFDDGPDDVVTPQLIAILETYNVKATFFLVGHMMVKFPHIVDTIVAHGHDIANHTWAHYRLDEMTQHQVGHQVAHTMMMSQQLRYTMKPYVRPPGGRFNDYVLREAAAQGLTMVMWDVNAADYEHPITGIPSAQAVANRVIRRIKPGSIVLMHNGEATVGALPVILDWLRSNQFSIGRIRW